MVVSESPVASCRNVIADRKRDVLSVFHLPESAILVDTVDGTDGRTDAGLLRRHTRRIVGDP